MKTLTKYHAPLLLDTIPASGVYTFNSAFGGPWNNGWKILSGNVQFLSQTYFDLAGMSLDEKTLFFDGMTTQDAGNVVFGGGQAGDSLVVYDIMTSIPVDLTKPDVYGNLINFGFGFPGSNLNFEHVLYQRRRRYTLDVDTAAAFCLIAEDSQSGSLMPTASDRVYSYRFATVYDISSTITAISLTGARHLMSATAKEEPTYEHMMRLKRSYDLQQEPDVD